MNSSIKATAIVKMECPDFFQIYLNSSWVSVEDFCNYCVINKIDPDKKIEKLQFKYRDKEYSFDKYNLELKQTSQKFMNDIEKHDFLDDEWIFLYNPDFYRSAQFFKQLGYNISSAFYYANKSYNKIPETFNNLKTYAGCFLKRTFDFNTSIMWYNTCFDYILQAFCARFSLYSELTNEDTQTMSFSELVTLVDFEKINNLATNHSSDREFNVWIKNIRRCRQELSTLNNTTNILKHRGGLKLVHFDLAPLMKIESNGKCNLDYFKLEKLDIDKDFILILNAHNSIVKCYKTLLTKLYKDIVNSKNAWETKMQKYKK